MLPARANYLVNYETPRAKAQFKHPDIRPPNDLMAVGLTILVRPLSLSHLSLTLTPTPPKRKPHDNVPN